MSGAKGNESAFFSDNTGKSFALNKDGQLVLGDFATATYEKVGDYPAQFSGDKPASAWSVTVTPGKSTIDTIDVKVNDKGSEEGTWNGVNITGEPVVFAVAVNLAAADVSSVTAVVNGYDIITKNID